MELKDFIKETLVQITDGVIAASEECASKGARVNPLMTSTAGIAQTQFNNSASVVGFHVTLCASSGKTESSGIGVFLANIGIGASGIHKEQDGASTKIDFSIPIELPHFNGDAGVVYGR